ncbi:hypothetical protein CKO40_23060, partial [Halochromatium glycolicum]|nr:hypothetical protein [Halochromatium glycolicum]
RGEQASFIKALLCSEASMRPEIFNAGLRVLSAAISEDGGNCCGLGETVQRIVAIVNGAGMKAER